MHFIFINLTKQVFFSGIQGLDFYLDKEGDVQYNFTLLDFRWNKSKPSRKFIIYAIACTSDQSDIFYLAWSEEFPEPNVEQNHERF